MPLERIMNSRQARERIHVRRNAAQQADGVICTFSVHEIRDLLNELEGRGAIGGAWIVLAEAESVLRENNLTP